MSLPPKRRRRETYHHGDLRQALIVAARELLIEQGHTELSLREVARRVGVAPSAAYNHFADRAALLHAVAEEGFVLLANAVREARESPATPRERLTAIGRAYIHAALANPPMYRLMFGPERVNRGEIAAGPSGAALLELALAVADVAPDIHVETNVAVMTLWSFIHGLALARMDWGDELGLDDALLDQSIEIGLRGIYAAS